METKTDTTQKTSSRYRDVAREFSLLANVKVQRGKKAAYAGTLIASMMEYALKKIGGRRPNLDHIISRRMKGRVFTAEYGKFKLVLMIDDVRQGLHDLERESYAAFKKYVKPGKTVCDVGAHIGTHTLKMADAVGFTKKKTMNASSINLDEVCPKLAAKSVENLSLRFSIAEISFCLLKSAWKNVQLHTFTPHMSHPALLTPYTFSFSPHT